MKLIQAQKAAKTNIFPDYWTLLYGRRLSDIMIKTLTGTLPLTFRTSENALRSWILYGNDFQQEESKSTRLPLSFYTDEDKLRNWTIYGNNTPHNYSATGTLPLTFTTHTAGNAENWSISGNDDIGENLFDENTITRNQSINYTTGITFSSQTSYLSDYIDINDAIALSILIINASGTTTSQANRGWCYFDAQQNFISGIQWAGRTSTSATFTVNSVPENAKYLRFSIDKNINAITLVKGSTAPDHYIPYQQGVGEQRQDGYYVPLTISQAGKPDKTVDIFIGDSPLTEGETVSKASTGVDIELFEDANTISTTLYNKPSMSIEGVDYVGVGEPTNDGWQIPLSVSDGTNTTTVNVPIDAPLTASDTATRTSTGVDIATADGTNTISTTLENKPQMRVDYGYKGAGEHVGNTWEFNFITSANGNQQLTRITMDKPLRAGKTLTSEQAGVTIPTYADAENTLSLYPSAAGYGNPEMTITYKE